MNDSLDLKICYFCGKTSKDKYTIAPNGLFNRVYLSAMYQGKRYPVCEKCAGTWDAGIRAMEQAHHKTIDSFFETMVVKKGELYGEVKTPK